MLATTEPGHVFWYSARTRDRRPVWWVHWWIPGSGGSQVGPTHWTWALCH